MPTLPTHQVGWGIEMGDMDNDGDLDGIAGLDGLPHGVLENVLQDTSLIEPILWDMAGELSNSANTRALALGP